jgi:ribonuclease E
LVKTPESMAIEVVRLLIRVAQCPEIEQVTVTVAVDVVDYLNNKKRHELVRLEDEGKLNVQIVAGSGVAPEYLAVECLDSQGRHVKLPKNQ